LTAEATRRERVAGTLSITIALQLRIGCRAPTIVSAALTERSWLSGEPRERNALVRAVPLLALVALTAIVAGCGGTHHTDPAGSSRPAHHQRGLRTTPKSAGPFAHPLGKA